MSELTELLCCQLRTKKSQDAEDMEAGGENLTHNLISKGLLFSYYRS